VASHCIHILFGTHSKPPDFSSHNEEADLQKQNKHQLLILATPWPKCTDLLPLTILEGDKERGYIKVEFEEQPAFGNLFGYIQGGFLSTMMNARCLSPHY